MDDVRPTPQDHAQLRERIAAVVGDRGLIQGEDALAPFVADQRGRYLGRTPFVVRPADTAEVAEVVRLCVAARVPMVPQGGNTGLVGGSIPFEAGEEVVISLGRMNQVRALDAANFTITVEAGCILQQVQAAAEAADRLFPLSLGAEGTCQIGGNLSTNAGGVHVLRYGNTRDLTLGLEVVLPDGQVWDGLRGLRKDNTGYDLKQLFVGGEGTLGIITAAVLKLFPRPRRTAVAFVGLAEVEAALALLGRCREASGDALTAFELIPRLGLDFALKHVARTVDPLAGEHPWYLLIEAASGRDDDDLRGAMEDVLMTAIEDGLAQDATVARNEAQAKSFWHIREAIVEAQKHEGGSIKHDVSVPVSAVPALLAEALPLVEKMLPGVRPIPFGHVGDGNIHLNLSQPEDVDREAFLARWDEVNHAVHDLVAALGGSISAEHGLGRMKRDEAAERKPAVEIAMMRAVKRALDPHNLMNPGKVVEL